jgi:hypothetical protein
VLATLSLRPVSNREVKKTLLFRGGARFKLHQGRPCRTRMSQRPQLNRVLLLREIDPVRFAGHAPVPLDVRHNVLGVDFGAVPVASLLLVTWNKRKAACETSGARRMKNVPTDSR